MNAEILRNNTLIAEFLNIKNDGIFFDCEHIEKFHEILKISGGEPEVVGYILPVENLKFHYDWNWLMLVVDRIESIIVDEDNSFNVTIGATNYCVIQDSNGELYESVEDYGENKLMTTYKACVQFVKWYNQNKG